MYLLYHCTYCTTVPIAPVYQCTHCKCTSIPVYTYCTSVPTVPVYPVYQCTYCTTVPTVPLYLLHQCTNVPTVSVPVYQCIPTVPVYPLYQLYHVPGSVPTAPVYIPLYKCTDVRYCSKATSQTNATFCDLRARIECNECALSMRTSLDFRILYAKMNVAKESSATGCKYRQIYPQTSFLREPSLDTDSTAL